MKKLINCHAAVNSINVNNSNVSLPIPAYRYIIYDNKLIILHDAGEIKESMVKENPGRNIWCYDLKGNLLWKIEESPRYFDWVKRGLNNDDYGKDSYMGLVYNEKEDKIYAFVQGRRYELDPETGRVSNFVDNIR